jgi:hypothetical protein
VLVPEGAEGEPATTAPWRPNRYLSVRKATWMPRRAPSAASWKGHCYDRISERGNERQGRERRVRRPHRRGCPGRKPLPVMTYLGIGAFWADAVFVSGLQRCHEPSAGQVRQAVAAAIRAFGCSGCAGRVAQEFGDHPETAVIRMRWARAVAREAFADPAPSPGSGADARALLVLRLRVPTEQAPGSPGAGQREPARSSAGGEG